MPETTTWTVAEVAEVIGISKNAVYHAVQRNRIPHIRVGRRVLFPKQPLLDWLHQQQPAVKAANERSKWFEAGRAARAADPRPINPAGVRKAAVILRRHLKVEPRDEAASSEATDDGPDDSMS